MNEDLSCMTKKQVRTLLGDDLVFWIDPAKVSLHNGGSKLPVTKHRLSFLKIIPKANRPLRPIKRFAARWEPFVIPSRYFNVGRIIDSDKRHRKIADLIANRHCPQESLWRKELMAQLASRGHARHKNMVMRTDAEIDAFIENYALGMVNALAYSGYDLRKSDEIGAAMIDPEGKLVKTGSATHRFCAAKILGLRAFPLRISGIHEDWVPKIRQGDGPLTASNLLTSLNEAVAPYL